jgi:LacI family transcriptional regulator
MLETANSGPVRGHATMTDVADAAGVSLKSVSRVINNEPHVSPKLRAKVEAAIAALHYVPDTAARSLAGARSFTIGVLFDNPSPNYVMKVLAGAYRACVEQQYHLRIDQLDSSVDAAALDAALDSIFRHSRSDGFVLPPPLSDDPRLLDALDRRGVRYSRLAPVLDPGRSMAVTIDDGAAAGRLADLMDDFGHRHFGVVNGPDSHGAASSRRSGFVQRLQERDPAVAIVEAYGGFAFEQGIAAGLTLLGQAHRPSAIFATNDDSAAGVMAACTQLGLVVPRDVSVCGFDDSWVAKTVWPYLTTIFQPIESMAYAAARMLLDRDPTQRSDWVRELDFELVLRDSVGPVPV